MASNTLYYGDNLDILRRYVQDESVDLVYLDPPFNSNQTYNILFREKDGSQSASQIKAFGDTWHWDETAALSYEETVEAGGQVAEAMQAFRKLLGTNDMLAYMSNDGSPPSGGFRRVLKPTGSIYLHCDPTASHYLKLLLDAVFGPKNLRNEIIWKRTSGRKGVSQYGSCPTTSFFTTRRPNRSAWNAPMVLQSAETVRGHDLMEDEGGVYRVSDFSGAGQGPPPNLRRSRQDCAAIREALDVRSGRR